MMLEEGSDDEDAPEQVMDKFLKRMRDTQFIQLEILQQSLNNQRQAICIQDIIQLENQRAQTDEVLSKRSLQIILRIEELNWSETEQNIQQRDKISDQVEELIDLKIEFNKIHVPQINKDFRELITLSNAVTRQIRNSLHVWLREQKDILKQRAKILDGKYDDAAKEQ